MNAHSVRSHNLLRAVLLLFVCAGNARAALTAIWQYQVPVVPPYVGHADPQRRAYLWVPPASTQLNGLLLGLSAATPFVWSRAVGISGDLVGRVIALLPWKGWFPGTCYTGIPIMYVDQEWQEVDSSWGTKWSSNQTTLKALRAKSGNTLL